MPLLQYLFSSFTQNRDWLTIVDPRKLETLQRRRVYDRFVFVQPQFNTTTCWYFCTFISGHQNIACGNRGSGPNSLLQAGWLDPLSISLLPVKTLCSPQNLLACQGVQSETFQLFYLTYTIGLDCQYLSLLVSRCLVMCIWRPCFSSSRSAVFKRNPCFAKTSNSTQYVW